MSLRKTSAIALLITATFTPVGLAHAEGTAQLGTTQALRAGTALTVDILDASVERIRWTGVGAVAVRSPDGTSLGTLANGDTLVPSVAGAYQLTVASQQNVGQVWDVAVLGQTDDRGRLSSTNWQFNAGSFASSASTSTSFYALVPTGAGLTSVLELDLDGLAGYIYDINANSTGVSGANAGRSVPEAGNSVTPMYSIYLQPPTLATYSSATPGVFGLDYVGGVSNDVFGQPLTPCDQILPGQSLGYFYFTSTVSGAYHLQCDLDQDGSFETTSTDDLLLVGAATVGTNVVAWDGRNGGAAVAPASYACRVRVTIGEFHYVGRDIETSYRGMRIYRVDSDQSRTGLPMYWNDSLVQGGDALMPNGAYGRERSEGQVVAGAYGSTPTPNADARSWGNFSGAGKGNLSLLDTFVWLDEAASAVIAVTAASAVDSDGDDLLDYEERCLVGSDPTLPDTDGDGTPDGTQYAVPDGTAFSGLESNGRLSGALARRAIARLRRSDGGERGAALPASSAGALAELAPASFEDVTAFPDPPSDLVALTNATQVYGADYVTAAGARRGGVLLVETSGALYEHQKAICDRVRGGELIDVRLGELRRVPLYRTLLVDRDDGRLERGVSLSLVEDPTTGSLVPLSYWIDDRALDIPAGARVITIQAWGSIEGFADRLLAAVLERAAVIAPVRWPAAPVPLDELTASDGRALAQPAPARLPQVIVEHGVALGAEVSLRLRRLSGGGPARLRVVALREDATTEETTLLPAPLGAGSTPLRFSLPLFLDATIEVLDGDRVVDRIWMTDGAWAQFDSSIWQPTPATASFSRSACVPRRRAALPGTVLELSGCAKATYDAVTDFAGVARHFTRPLRLSGAASLTYWIASDRPYQVCAERAGARRCVAMPARPAGAFEAIPTASLGEEPELVSFFAERTGALAMEVSTMTLSSEALDTRPAATGGCAIAPDGAWLWILSVLGWALGRRRAATSRRARRAP